MRIGALDRHTRDWVVESTADRTRAVLKTYGLAAEGISYVETHEMLAGMARDLGASSRMQSRTDIRRRTAGGTASNVLYNLGCIQATGDHRFSLEWFGTTARHNPTEFITPIDTLRRVGVIPHCSAEVDEDAVALCVVEHESRSVIVVLVARGTPIRANELWHPPDITIVGLDTFVNAHESVRGWTARSQAVALLVDSGITPALNSELMPWGDLTKQLRWVIGRHDDLRTLAMFDREPHPALSHSEIVATRGPDPVVVWDPDGQACRSFVLPEVHHATGDDLGAGDAYAGSYMYGRVAGRSISSAHDLASSWARRLLDANGARLPAPVDLNEVFGRAIQRHSARRTEGQLFDRVRQTHGLTVLTGGQTGVDHLGLECADALGLAAFAVVPKGGRTENADSPLLEDTARTDACIVELASGSFRFRTWANGYLSDGTLIWDLHGGAGSEATRQACNALGRPYLDFGASDFEAMLRRARAWAAEHRIRVVNVAGNRRSLLTAVEVDVVRSQIKEVLRCLAVDRARRNPTTDIPSIDLGTALNDGNGIRLGAPDASAYRALAIDFFRQRLQGEAMRPRALVGSSAKNGVDIAFARARELPQLLDASGVDVIICGADVIQESRVDTRLLMATGLFNQLLAFIGREREPSDGPVKVVSQYPHLARVALEDRGWDYTLEPITGSAEAWLRLGLADMAFDTWRTGRTAEANGLRMLEPAGCSSLVMATSPTALAKRANGIFWLAREFQGWLGC